MNIQIKLIDPSLPLPQYQTEGAVAFDLYSRTDVEIEPGETAMVPLNVVIAVPEGYGLILASRSSTGKKGIRMVNGIGIIDQDYCGDEDEIRFFCQNYTDKKVKIEKGERITQAMFVKIDKPEFEQVEKMDSKNRGGFGSTG